MKIKIKSFPSMEKLASVFSKEKLSFALSKEKISSTLPKEKIPYTLSKEKIVSALSRENISSTLSKIPMKQKLVSVAATIPFVAASTMSSSCATTCPYGMVNDPAPGQCSRYMDIGGDGFCDFSQATPVTTTDPATTTTDTTTTSPINEGHGNGVNGDIATDQADTNATVIPDSGFDSGNLNGDPTNYYVLPISFMLMGVYLLTHFLFKKGILKRNKHRRIWNLLVTAGYLGTGVTGVVLTLLINLGIRTALNPAITFWHAELAILMVIGTMIHLHLYWKPFKNMFKVLFRFNTNLRKNPTKVKGTSK